MITFGLDYIYKCLDDLIKNIDNVSFADIDDETRIIIGINTILDYERFKILIQNNIITMSTDLPKDFKVNNQQPLITQIYNNWVFNARKKASVDRVEWRKFTDLYSKTKDLKQL